MIIDFQEDFDADVGFEEDGEGDETCQCFDCKKKREQELYADDWER